MNSIRRTFAVAALALSAVSAGPTQILAQQLYECTTTTRTTVSTKRLDDGSFIITTVSVSSRVCVPL
jgi:hypothetical protein